MTDRELNDEEANAINEQMAAAMERRRAMPDQRRNRRSQRARLVERRRVCAYCFQPGDHPTAAHCRRALERPSRRQPS